MLAADDVVSMIRAAGGLVEAREFDLADPDTLPKIFDWVEAVFGPVDVLVNYAAHYEHADSIFDTTVNGLDRTCSINMQAAVMLTAEYVRCYERYNSKTERVTNLSTDAAQTFAGQIA